MRPAPLAASSGRPPTSWCSWGCGWRWTWCRSLCHRCSMTLASSLPPWERNHSAGQRCQVSVSSPLTCVWRWKVWDRISCDQLVWCRGIQLVAGGVVPAAWCPTSWWGIQVISSPPLVLLPPSSTVSAPIHKGGIAGVKIWICGTFALIRASCKVCSLCWELLSLVCIYARAHWLQLIAKVRVEPWQEGKALSQLVSASIFNWDKQQTTFSNLLRLSRYRHRLGWHSLSSFYIFVGSFRTIQTN